MGKIKYELIDPQTGKANLFAESIREAKFWQNKFPFSGLQIKKKR